MSAPVDRDPMLGHGSSLLTGPQVALTLGIDECCAPHFRGRHTMKTDLWDVEKCLLEVVESVIIAGRSTVESDERQSGTRLEVPIMTRWYRLGACV